MNADPFSRVLGPARSSRPDRPLPVPDSDPALRELLDVLIDSPERQGRPDAAAALADGAGLFAARTADEHMDLAALALLFDRAGVSFDPGRHWHDGARTAVRDALHASLRERRRDPGDLTAAALHGAARHVVAALQDRTDALTEHYLPAAHRSVCQTRGIDPHTLLDDAAWTALLLCAAATPREVPTLARSAFATAMRAHAHTADPPRGACAHRCERLPTAPCWTP